VDPLALGLLLAAALFAMIEGVLLLTADVREESRNAATKLRLRRPSLADGVSPWLRDILLTAPVQNFDNLVQTSGLAWRTERVLMGMVLLTVSAVAALELRAFGPYGFPGGLAFGIGLPLLALVRMRARRTRRLTAQVPEMLDMIVRSLRAGHPIPACVALVAKDMPDPMGGEFRRVHDAMSYGLNLRDALSKMAERLHMIGELNYVITAIKIQSATGGNLAEILASLATLLREQHKLKMKVKAISAEGRLSGNILGALPVVVVALLNLIDPDYYRGLSDEPSMLCALGAAAALVVLSHVFIRRIVKIRV
jgi:tight adherence protein B